MEMKPADFNSTRRLLIASIEALALIGALLLANIYSLAGYHQFPDVRMFSGEGWALFVPAVFVAGTLVVLIVSRGLWQVWLAAWKSNLLVLFFLAIAIGSLAWSVYFEATLYKLVFLIVATLAGTYLTVRSGRRGLIGAFTWIAAVCVLLSLAVVLFFPVGIMENFPYTGSWRGMYWHRNHLGSLAAFFNMLFLYRLLDNARATPAALRALFGLFYILSAVLVFASRSATGVIVFAVLHGAAALAWLWLKLSTRLRRGHYLAVGFLFLTAALIFMSNTGFFFGLLGRSASMTGRVPLWQDLTATFWIQKPFLGYGYGALWMQAEFRELMMQRQHWTLFPVHFADNGYLDLLLNLGLAGFLPFAAFFAGFGMRAVRKAVASRSWLYFFPVFGFLYVLVANISYSFLLEVDQFVWLILITLMFLPGQDTPSPGERAFRA